MCRVLTATLAAALLCTTAGSARANSCGSAPPETLLVIDRSGSMASSVGGYSKWLIAVNAVNQLLGAFNGQLAFGLMIFPGDGFLAGFCGTGRIKVATSTTSSSAILAALKKAGTPTSGGTPLGASLDGARKYLLGLGTKTPKNIIVVTDGGESCGGDPAAEAAALKAVGITTYVVGFNAAVVAATLQKVAQAGGSGRYYSAGNLTQLTAALKQIAGSLTCCGNGKIDTGETCDTKISGGLSGACPASCDDDNPCTKDTLAGSGCSAKCTHINTCISQCGNRKVEPGEWCDSAIARGVKGACPTRCASSDRCTVSTLEGKGCLAHCTTRPAAANAVKKDGCCPKGMSKKDDADCKPLCGPDDTASSDCIDLCRSVTCGRGKICRQGKCVAGGASARTGSRGAGAGAQRPRTGHYVGGCAMAGDGATDADGPPPSLVLLLGLALWLRLGTRRRRRPWRSTTALAVDDGLSGRRRP